MKMVEAFAVGAIVSSSESIKKGTKTLLLVMVRNITLTPHYFLTSFLMVRGITKLVH